MFLINIPVAVILIFASLKTIPNRRIEKSGLFDWKGILSMGLMLATFTYGINNIDSSDFPTSLLSAKSFPYLLASLLLLFITFFIEKKAENPIIKLIYLKNSQILVAGTIAVATGVLQSSFVFIPTYAVGLFGVSPSDASFMLIPLVLATAVGSPVFGRLIDQTGSKIIIISGLLMSASGFYLIHLTGSEKWLFYISGILIGLGLSILAGSSLRYIMLNETAAVDRAVTQGMLTIFISLGQLTGAALIGVFIARATGMSGLKTVFFYQSVFLIIILSTAFLLKNREKEKAGINV